MYIELAEIRLDKHTQESILIAMGSSEDVLEFGCERLKPSDFNWCVTRAVAEALIKLYTRYKKMPTMQVLALTTKKLMQGVDTSFVDVPETEKPLVVKLLKQINRGRCIPCDEAWAKDAIVQYRKQLRLHHLSGMLSHAVNTGIGVDEAYQQAAGLAKEARQDEGSDPEFEEMFDSSVMTQESKDVRHIPTGIPGIDEALAGGPMPGELGLLIACQGVGKTNVMLNACVSAVKQGLYNLFISAEMPKKNLTTRIYAMAACINAVEFRRKGIQDLAIEERERIALVEKSFAGGRLRCVDFSSQALTYDKLVAVCEEWDNWLIANNLKDKAGLVCIDYLDLIQFSGNLGGDLNDLDPQVIPTMMKAFRKDVVSKRDMSVLIAGQANSGAEGKRVFQRKDVAWAYHASDAIHYGCGVADETDNRQKMLAAAAEAGAKVDNSQYDITKHGKTMILSFFKVREGDACIAKMYQAPTMRIYDSQREFSVVRDAVKNGMNDVLLGVN